MKKEFLPRFILILTTLMIWTAAKPAQATHVTVFVNATYVNYSPGDPDAEASNIEDAAASFGHTVSSFIEITGADFTAALTDQEVLIIPDLEFGDLAPDLSPEAITAINAFVTGGGRLVIANSDNGPNATAFLNTVFGFSLAEDDVNTGVPSTITSAAAGTIFEGQAANLPGNNATMAFNNLPPGGISIYNTAFGASMIYIIPVGAGEVVYLGYDWFQSDPPNAGQQDGGWTNILAAALADTDLSVVKTGTPNPVVMGDVITFTLTVANNGPNDAIGVELTDALPAELAFVSANPSQGSCSGTTMIVCALGILANGSSATFTLVATAVTVGTFDNTAVVSSQTYEVDGANNQDTETVTVNPVPILLNLSGDGCSLNPAAMPLGKFWLLGWPFIIIPLVWARRRLAKL